MRKIISFAGQKGGAGKTTATLNIAYNLSRLGGRVLIIDADPQGGIAVATNLKKRTNLGLIDVMKKQCSPQEIVMTTRENTLSIAGVGIADPDDVALFETEAAKGTLRDLLRRLSLDYSYTLIDAPAGIGGIVTALLSSSDSVILVTQSRTLSLKTLPSFLKLIQWVRTKYGVPLHFEGIICNMIEKNNPFELQLFDETKKMFPPEAFFETTIPYDLLFEQASARAVPVAMLRQGAELSNIYMRLALELKEREMKRENGGGLDDSVEGLF